MVRTVMSRAIDMSNKITGMLAIGNGEKCPFCETIMDEDKDTFKHLTDNHSEEFWEHMETNVKSILTNRKENNNGNTNDRTDKKSTSRT